ncbi:MAG: hypothetical protein WCA00_01135 [Candidatus Acidiferrales bacterium]
MRSEPEDLPVACSLPDADLREREATLLTKFRSAVIRTEELDDGFIYRLATNENSIACAAALILAERECCPFLTFALTAAPRRGPVDLRVTGPAGTKEFLRTMLHRPD